MNGPRLADRAEYSGYQPVASGFNLNVGSALKAILPAAFQASVIGSVLVAIGFIVFDIVTAGGTLIELGPAGVVMAFCAWFVFGTIAGTLFATFYIAAFGLPLALVMRHHLSNRYAMLAVLVTSTVAGVTAVHYLIDSGDAEAIAYGFVFAYALPAGITYRRAILLERFLAAFE